MKTINLKLSALIFTLPVLTLSLNHDANAEIYKWRDSRGIIQYSDRAPLNKASKLTRNDLVNSLQTKDLCTDGPIRKNALLKSIEKNISVLAFSRKNPKSTTTSTSTSPTTSTTTSTATSPTTTTATTSTATSPTTSTTSTTSNTTTTNTSSALTTTSPTTTTLSSSSTTPTTSTTTLVATAPTTTSSTTSTTNNIIQTGLMPAVDISKDIPPVVGFSSLQIRPTTEIANVTDVGAFRVVCGVSHMSNDDPMVFPGQKNATHHHTFYGNTQVKYDTDLNALPTNGNSTCFGGIMNRSAYWHPTMINTLTNTAVLPENNQAIFYYKTGYNGVKPADIKAPPKGLRMLVGNPRAVNSTEIQRTTYKCLSNGVTKYKSIPNCAVGDAVQLLIDFPQCWDGKNLDSPNHKDHMAFASNATNGCPASHPVAIPEISLNMTYKITTANQATNWRLSSDNYVKNGLNAGYSGHADWVNGWDETIFAGIVRNCLNASKDCKAHLLGDGRMYY